jgi:hypothetical protein
MHILELNLGHRFCKWRSVALYSAAISPHVGLLAGNKNQQAPKNMAQITMPKDVKKRDLSLILEWYNVCDFDG